MDVQQVLAVVAKGPLLDMKTALTYIACLMVVFCSAQKNISKLLKKYNSETVPYAYVEDLANSKTETILLDAREPSEYQISHLKNAICVGYDNFDIEAVKTQIPDKDKKIVVYCSLGIRSEVIAQKLIDAGYTDVKNLYGGIFEWKNSDQSVYNAKNKETDSVHAFSQEWSKWLTNGIKVYE